MKEGDVSGTAYGFFKCDASPEEVTDEVAFIRGLHSVKSQLELTLTDDVESLEGDVGLYAIACDARDSGQNYVLKARGSGENNEYAADDLAQVLSQAYQSPLYNGSGPFNGKIVYKDGETYKVIESELSS